MKKGMASISLSCVLSRCSPRREDVPNLDEEYLILLCIGADAVGKKRYRFSMSWDVDFELDTHFAMNAKQRCCKILYSLYAYRQDSEYHRQLRNEPSWLALSTGLMLRLPMKSNLCFE